MDYTITKRVRTDFVDETGVAVDGYRVYFTMSDGTPDYVEVPKPRYTRANVEAAIEAVIEAHQDVVG